MASSITSVISTALTSSNHHFHIAPAFRPERRALWRESLAAIEHLSKTGGGERDRTDDLLLAKQALSQLSYTPGRTCTINNGGPEKS